MDCRCVKEKINVACRWVREKRLKSKVSVVIGLKHVPLQDNEALFRLTMPDCSLAFLDMRFLAICQNVDLEKTTTVINCNTAEFCYLDY